MSYPTKLSTLIVLLGAGLGAHSAQAQGSLQTCYQYLLAATEAQTRTSMLPELEKFRAAGCDKAPHPAALSKVSVETLMFLHYRQSMRRAELEAQIVSSPSVKPPNRGAGSGAAATIGAGGSSARNPGSSATMAD